MGDPIVADPAALSSAQQSASSVGQACSGAGGTVSAMGGVSLPDCAILSAAWSRFANSSGAYLSAFGEAAGVLGGKLGQAAQNYHAADTHVATAASNSGGGGSW